MQRMRVRAYSRHLRVQHQPSTQFPFLRPPRARVRHQPEPDGHTGQVGPAAQPVPPRIPAQPDHPGLAGRKDDARDPATDLGQGQGGDKGYWPASGELSHEEVDDASNGWPCGHHIFWISKPVNLSEFWWEEVLVLAFAKDFRNHTSFGAYGNYLLNCNFEELVTNSKVFCARKYD